MGLSPFLRVSLIESLPDGLRLSEGLTGTFENILPFCLCCGILSAWADSAAGGPPSRLRTNAKGGDHMTDYEMIMVFLTFLTLLLMASKKNDG